MDKAMQLLDEMLFVGDELADRLAEEIGAQGGARDVADRLTKLARGGPPRHLEKHDPHLMAALEMFDAETDALPAWHRDSEIRRGNDLFEDNALLGFIVLACASLPHCYCWRDEARILGLTQQLTAHVERRIPETAQFVLDVMGDVGMIGPGHDDSIPLGTAPGGTGPVPDGIRSIQKVRLMHALMRYLILHDPGEVDDFLGTSQRPVLSDHMMRAQWSVAVNGKPISQSFLAGTLLTFSLVVVDGLRDLWAPVGDRDALAYLHIWKIIGHNMGIREELLAYFDDLDQARALHGAMMARHRAPTAEGAMLAAALERYMQDSIVDRVPLARPLGMRYLPRVLTWHLSERDTCRAIGQVPEAWPRIYGLVAWSGLRILGLMKRLPLLRHASDWVFRWLATVMWDFRVEDVETAPDTKPGAKGETVMSRGAATARGKRSPRVPKELAEKWGMR